MRAVAVLLVLGNHAAGSHFPGGGLGVDIFFVLSGFLITRLLIEEWRDTGQISLRDFYARRALRLLPALLLVLLFVFAAPRLLADVGDIKKFINLRDVIGPITYSSNWLLMLHYDEANLMPHAWSLAVEEQFYLVWPIILICLLRWTVPASLLLRCALFLALLASVVMAVRAGLGTPSYVLYAGPESRGGLMLLTGCAVAFWFDRAYLENSRLARLAELSWPLAAAVIAVLVLTATQSSRFLYYGGWLVVAVCVAVLLIAALGESNLISRLLSYGPLVWIGSISYGLYLWNVPIIKLVSSIMSPDGHGSAIIAAIAVPSAVLLSGLSFYAVERPVRRWGRNWLLLRYRAPGQAASGISACPAPDVKGMMR